jgi:hypothetical protein
VKGSHILYSSPSHNNYCNDDKSANGPELEEVATKVDDDINGQSQDETGRSWDEDTILGHQDGNSGIFTTLRWFLIEKHAVRRFHCCTGKPVSMTYSRCVCRLRYLACNVHAPYCPVWPTQLYNILPHHLMNSKIFLKKSY